MNSAGSSPVLRWADQLAIAHNEMMVVAMIISDLLDERRCGEAEFSRLALAGMRLRALMEYRNELA
jgi:hypothetical protein